MKRLTLMLLITVLALFVIPAYAGMEDKSDQLSANQSSVFSPGYINASKQKTDNIIYQQNKPKTFMENTMDYVKKKLGKDVAEDSVNKPELELKKKAGGGGEQSTRLQAVSSDIVVEMPNPTTPGEIPIDVRSSVQEFLNNQTGTVGDHRIVFNGGRYTVCWTETGADSKSSLKTQVFDSVGKALLSNPYNISCDVGNPNIMNMTKYSSGNLAVFWREYGASNTYSFKAQVLDADGRALNSNPYSLLANNGSVILNSVTALSGGNLAVVWQENLVGTTKFSLKTQVFDAGGKALLSNPYGIVSSMGVSDTVNVNTFSNGNLAVYWSERGADNKFSLREQIFDTGGLALYSNKYSLANNTSGARVNNLTTLSNGNLAVFWQERGADGRTLLKEQVFDTAGRALFSNPYTLASNLNGVIINNVTTFSNGNLAVFWLEYGMDSKYSLKEQVFDAGGKALLSNPYTIAVNTKYASLQNVTALSNGNLAVFWYERAADNGDYSFKTQIFDTGGRALLPNSYSLANNFGNVALSNVTALSNGNFAVFWNEMGMDFKYAFKTQVFDSRGQALLSSPYSLANNLKNFGMDNVTVLSDGNLAVFWNEIGADSNYLLKAQVFDRGGRALFSNPYVLTNNRYSASVYNITALSDGRFAIFWKQYGADKTLLTSQVLDSTGKGMTFENFSKSISDAAVNRLMQGMAANQLLNPYSAPSIAQTSIQLPFNFENGKAIIADKGLGEVFKGLLANTDRLKGDAAGAMNPTAIAKIVQDSLQASALALPGGQIDPKEMEIAMKLASIMQNPTDDQKLILDVALSMMNAEKDGSKSPELKKASDDLLQMVAAVLIAQAMPDLLKEGDAANIKNAFSELNNSKVKIMLEYNEAVKPYYGEIKKLLSKNIALLQLNNIVSKSMMAEELNRLEPNEVDKIFDKLRKASNGSFEEEYILQQEAKYRKAYIEPNKRVLEDKMKTMMKEFTQRLSGILEGTKK